MFKLLKVNSFYIKMRFGYLKYFKLGIEVHLTFQISVYL